jgi:hypothetical protein
MNLNVLLITPPFTQFNSPYPAISYLAAFLSEKKCHPIQRDFSLELILKLFSKEGLYKIREVLLTGPQENHTDSIHFFLEAFDQYASSIEVVMEFLKNKDSVMALRIVSGLLIPEGPRFTQAEDQNTLLKKMFGELGTQDKAKYLASLYLDDISDVINHGIDPFFQLSRYGDKLAASQADFSPLHDYLHHHQSLLDHFLEELVIDALKKSNHRPLQLVILTAPFPGNFPLALKIAKLIWAPCNNDRYSRYKTN